MRRVRKGSLTKITFGKGEGNGKGEGPREAGWQKKKKQNREI